MIAEHQLVNRAQQTHCLEQASEPGERANGGFGGYVSYPPSWTILSGVPYPPSWTILSGVSYPPELDNPQRTLTG